MLVVTRRMASEGCGIAKSLQRHNVVTVFADMCSYHCQSTASSTWVRSLRHNMHCDCSSIHSLTHSPTHQPTKPKPHLIQPKKKKKPPITFFFKGSRLYVPQSDHECWLFPLKLKKKRKGKKKKKERKKERKERNLLPFRYFFLFLCCRTRIRFHQFSHLSTYRYPKKKKKKKTYIN